MAKKETFKLDDDFNFDEDLNIPGFNFGEDGIKDNRKATSKVKDAIIAGAKQSLTNPSTYGRFLRSALPKEYGEAYDDADRIGQNVKRVYKEAIEEVKPAAADLARSLDTFVPESMNRSKKLLKTIQDWDSGNRQLKDDTSKIREDNISLELGKVFKTQMEQEVKARAEDKSKQKIDDALGFIRHRDQMGALNQLAMDMRRLAQYETTVTQAYQKKSLELQYRSYYLQADLLELQRKNTVATTQRLDAIVKNTALPDFVKTRKSEYMKEQIRNQYINSAVGGFFGSNKEKVERFFENISRKFKAGASQAVTAFGAGAMGLDTASSMKDMGGAMNKSFMETAVEEGVAMAISSLAGKAGYGTKNLINKKFPKFGRKIEMTAKDLQYIKENGFGALEDFAKSGNGNMMGYKDAALSILKNMIYDNLDKGTSSILTQHDRFSDIRNPVAFNQQAHKSITEVIPGLLSRILREVTVLRTGNNDTSMVEYDYTSNKFSTSKAISKDIVNSMYKDRDTDWMSRNFDSFLEDVGMKENLKGDEKKALIRSMLKQRFSGGSMSKQFFANADSYSGISNKKKEKLAKLFEDYYSAVDVPGENQQLEQKKRRANIAQWGNMLGDELGDPRALIQQHINAGNAEKLREAGILNEYGNIDISKLVELASKDVGTIASDKFIKENITSFNPKDALEGIRNIGIKLWNYKKGSKADDGGETHIGPMAQDIQSQLGDQVAPNGKKINIANLTSAAMAGVQALDEKTKGIAQLVKSQLTIFAALMRDKIKGNELFEGTSSLGSNKTASVSRAVSLSDRLRSMEELLAIIAANTSHTGAGVDFNERFVKNGKLSKFRVRWPEMFKAKRKTESEQKQREAKEQEASKFSKFKDDLPGLIGNLAQTTANIGQRVGTRLWSGIQAVSSSLNKKFSRFKRNVALPAAEAAAEIAKQKYITIRDRLDGIDDVYVRGEKSPRMYKTKLAQGIYVDFNTQKVIHSLRDIAGAVMDSSDGSIVVSDEEVASLVLRPTLVSRTIDIGKELFAKAKGFASDTVNKYLPAGWGMVYGVGKKLAGAALTFIDYPRDVYVKGEDKPRLFKHGFINGEYYSKAKGSVINRPGQIKGEVIDKDGNTLISNEDLSKGLTDAKGMAIYSTGAMVAGLVGGMARKGLSAVHNLLKTGKDMFGTLATKGFRGVKDFFTNFGIGFGGKETLDVLKQIRDILDTRLNPSKRKVLGDNDDSGYRDGSWQDLKKLGNVNKNNHGVRAKDKDKPGKDKKERENIFDKVTDMISGLISGAMGLLGLGGLFGGKAKAAAGAAAAVKKSGLLSKLGGLFTGGLGLLGGGSAAGSAAKAAAGSGALGTLAKGAGALGSGALAAGGTGLGLLGALHRSGMAGVNAVGRMAAGAAPGLAGLAGGAMRATGGLLKGTAMLGKGIGAVGTGIGAAAKLGLKALPGIGAAYGLYSAGSDALAGNYGSAAMNLGLASLSGLGVGGTLSLLGSAGGALAGAIFSPVGLGLLAAGAAGYGLYKGYKWLTKKDYSSLALLRMFQYGIGDQDKEFREQIYNLEKLLEPSVQINGNEVKIAEGKLKLEDILKIFKIKEDDNESIQRFGAWFQNRFKPVYFTHLSAIFQMKGKARVDDIDTELKDPRDKLEFLNKVAMPDGPWGVSELPFPNGPKSIIGGGDIADIVARLRKVFSSQIKPGEDQSQGKRSWLSKLISPEPEKAEGRVDKIKPKDNVSDTSKKIASVMRSDVGLKGGLAMVTVGSEKGTGWAFNKVVSAFEAVKLKAYGLDKLEQGYVASIRWLENVCTDKLKKKADGTTAWTGDVVELLETARRYFGFDFNNKKQDERWSMWFLKRFLPIFTTVKNRIAKVMGNDNYKAQESSFDETSLEAIKIAEHIVTMQDAWSVNASPWPDVTLGMDPSVTKENIEFMKKAQKDKEAIEQKLPSSSAATAGATGSVASKISEDNDYQKRIAESKARQDEQVKKIQAWQKQNDAKAGVTNAVSDEGEPDQKAIGSTSAAVSKQASGGLSGGGGSSNPPLAAGDISNGAAAEQYLKYANGAKLNNMHPEFLKLFMGAVQEYGEKTGKQVQVNAGFRSYEQQAALKKKYGARAAAPGNSLHEYGMAIDINSADADAMEKLGLMKKYGLTRPVGAEPWHIEPAGIQNDYNGYKKNWQAANDAIKSGAGFGGGGYGTVAGARRYGRNAELAKQLLANAGTPGQGVEEAAKSQADAAITKAQDSSRETTRGMKRNADGTNVMPTGKPSEVYKGGVTGGGSVEATTSSSPRGLAASMGAEPKDNSTSTSSGSSSSNSNSSARTTSAGSGSSVSGSSTSTGAGVPEGVKGLLNQISSGEGTTDDKAKRAGFASAYDVPLGYGKFGKPDKPITEMTLGELKVYMNTVRKNSGKMNSSAMGKYQIVGTTLRDLQKKLGISDDAKFTPELQDKMGMELLNRRGLQKFMSGKMSARDFQANLYHEWASIAHPDTGKAKQHTGTSNEQIQAALHGVLGGKGSVASNFGAASTASSAGLTPDTNAANGSKMTKTADGLNIINSTADANRRQNATRTPSSAFNYSDSSAGSYSDNSAAVSDYNSSYNRNSRDAISSGFRTSPTVAIAPRVQPEIKQGDQQITKSVQNVESILGDSLNVQRQILNAIQGLGSMAAQPGAVQPTSVVNPDTGTQTPTYAPDRSVKEVAKSPLSLKNKVLT